MQKALEIKINDLNLLESTLWQYGSPINVTDYLLYRHCLLYTHVAKDSAIINSSSEVRFYIKDDNKEIELQNKLRLSTNNAKVNFVKLLNDAKQFKNAVEIDDVNLASNILSKWNKNDANYKYATLIFEGMPPSELSLTEMNELLSSADNMKATNESLKEWYRSTAVEVINLNK